MNYQERDVLVDEAGGRRLRVVLRQPDQTWLFDLSARLAWPHPEQTPELDAMVDRGDLEKEAPGERAYFSARIREQALAKHRRFKPAFQTVHALLTPSGRGRCFRTLKAADRKLTRRVFDRAARQWLAGGRTPMAFAPRWSNCGPTPVDTTDLDSIPYEHARAHARELALAIDPTAFPLPESTATHTKAGKPRRRIAPQLPTLFRVDRLVLRVFLFFFAWKLAEVGRSLWQAYKQMCSEVFVGLTAAGERYDLDLRQIPSFHTFEYWYFKLTSHAKRRIGQRGQKHFDLNEREELGDEVSKALLAGLVGSGDATIWNVGIRSRFAGRRAVGPPVVFRIRCKKSGMPLGLSVSLDSASWIGMASALSNCLEDKVAYCARYGITIKPEDWPVAGLPGILEVDRGETDNHHPTAFIELTGVEVENLQGQRPDMKPGSESDWRTLQVRLNGMTPGAIVETWENQSNAAWKLDGEMDIDQFTALLIQHELDRIKTIREGVHLDDEMIAADVVRTPQSMWRYDVEHKGGGLVSFDKAEVELSLLPREAGSITESGVYFRGCYFLCKELLAQHAFAKARVSGRAPVVAAFDPRLVDTIHVVGVRGEPVHPYYACRLNMNLRHQVAYVGKTFAEVRELQQKDAANTAQYAPQEHASALDTHRAHAQSTRDAAKQTQRDADHSNSKAAQLRELPRARKDERNSHSPTLALTARRASQSDDATPAPAIPLPTPSALPSSSDDQTAEGSRPSKTSKSSYRELLRRATHQSDRTQP